MVRPALHLKGTKGTRPALVSLVTSVSVSVRRGPIPWFVTLTFCDVLRFLIQEAVVVAIGVMMVAIVTVAVVIAIAVI